MSIKVMNLIWEIAPYKGNTLLTLLALGDWSDDDGVSWPHMKTLAVKSRQTVRNVNYAIDKLRSDGILTVQINPGRGKGNEFHINLQLLQVLREQKTCKMRQENLKNTTRKPEKRDNAIRKNRQEPSENHKYPPYPPSGGPTRDLTPRELHNLSKELNQIYQASVGVSHSDDFEEQAIRTACIRLTLPLESARRAIAASEGKKQPERVMA